MNDVDRSLMEREGLVFKRVIATTKRGAVFLVVWTKYNNVFSLERVDLSRYDGNEVNILKGLYHSNIINVYRYWVEDHSVYILMDYCPFDLYHIIHNRGPISEDKFIGYAYEILQSIKNCHDKSICHCNLRPSKFLIDKYNHIQVSDFSDAQCAPDLDEDKISELKSEDVWSIGVTFYYMMTGILITDLCMSIDDAKSKDFSKVRFPQFYSQETIDIVLRCLSKSPSDRPSVDEILRSPVFKRRRPSSLSIPSSGLGTSSMHTFPYIVKPVLTRIIGESCPASFSCNFSNV